MVRKQLGVNIAISWWTLASLVAFASALTPDGEALLELKIGFNDSKQLLWSWRRTDSHPCSSWLGVSCHLSDLTVRSIDLPYMQLSGIISASIGRLQRLQRLALHRNSLHGPIPIEIKNCTELRALYLRYNYLQGNIPPEIGELVHLTILDLSNNLLKGTIPPTIGRLSQLRVLNLSTNFLSGEVPTVGVLGTFQRTSFVGNLELCGLPIQKVCHSTGGTLGFPAVLPHSDAFASPGLASFSSKRTSHFLNGIIIGAVTTMAFALVTILAFLWICLLSRKERLAGTYVKVKKQLVQDGGSKLVIFHGNLPYSSQEIIKKLELLDEDDMIGSGGFGTVYKMVIDDNCVFAVKKIDRNREISNQIFERELEILGSIKHVNLVNLRGYCRLRSARLLIYDYLDLGSLDHYLHEDSQEEHPLNWNARMKIALGAAKGLAYLHHDCTPRIVHKDFKSSNILLDRSLEPHLSDFGLAKLLVDGDAHVTTVVAGTFGYLAPEYLESGIATDKSDAYSFGVLLLELVTGKRPTDPSFVRRGLDIVGWLNTLAEDNSLEEIIDRKCGSVDVEAVEAIIDVAAMCTDSNPDNRPSMSRVLQMLEEEIMSPCLNDELYETHLYI
ncbi:LRR receptor-like serine/threonine-protein kinase FEI 2 isoform X1 [Zingiber officinale]|uniref:LRR receptor-like serine/threonine-protein kinase FEI 2 isoform X1 n=1 Tax=Zingiber officinale TaxID=94328 RepID=UPI001C4C0FD4|nr:LRR receptor-like serine/threonine-protein kinase FEI 2 isoform X1 [Zingiber officinale]